MIKINSIATLGLLICSTSMAYSFSPSNQNKIPAGQGYELTSYDDGLYASQMNRISSRFVCNHPKFGNYLYLRDENTSYTLDNGICEQIESILRGNPNSLIYVYFGEKNPRRLRVLDDSRALHEYYFLGNKFINL